jgi:23S rRNA pseudouridine1911/1915/1917 synthase
VSSTTHIVDRKEAGRTLSAVVKQWTQRSWSQVRAEITSGRIWVNGQACTDIAQRLRFRDVIAKAPVDLKKHSHLRTPKAAIGKRKPSREANEVDIVHLDEDVIVVDKPSGITTMRHESESAEFGERGRRFLPTTLADQLRRLLPGEIRAVHRIDRDTSGLVVFARNAASAQHLGQQFRDHSLKRIYLAWVRGKPVEGRIESHLIADRGDGRRGSSPDRTGKRAVTHVRLVESLGETALVECRLDTGRTHQIRIHLGEAGTPLAGERIYDRPLHGAPLPDPSGSPRLALHSALMGFVHPRLGTWMEWRSDLPPDLQARIRRIRARNVRET